MVNQSELIVTVAGALGAALALGLVTQKLRLSPIVGYLLAGILVGPFTPGFVADTKTAEQLAELGVILLMFGVGVHFRAGDLLAVRRVAVPGALIQIAVATGLGVLVTGAFGFSVGAGVVFGLAISVASTVVLVRMLSDNNTLHTPSGHVAVGWLVVEDIFTVLALVLLPIVAGQGTELDRNRGPWLAIGGALLRIAGLIGAAWALGRWLVPRLLAHVAETRSAELFTLGVLVLVLGIATGSAALFGVSMALGAFLAGMIVGQSEFSFRAASEALPMRDAFAVLFFVAVGMLLDPDRLWSLAPLVAATVAIVIVGKACAAFLAVRLLGHPVRTALTVAVALAQVGEFSFILATLGKDLHILPEVASQVLVATAIVSITLNPLLFRLIEPLIRRLAPTAYGVSPSAPASDEPPGAIVIGYGPVGRAVVRLLGENSIRPMIVELNHQTVKDLHREGMLAIYGDASRASTLEEAGIRSVGTLFFAASGSPPEAVVNAARSLNPRVRILARSTYAREVPAARRAGADVVVCAESEVALAMTERLMSELGATPDQLDRARDRLRRELAAATV